MNTKLPKIKNYKRSFYLIDAEGLSLGQLAVHASKLLRGKNNPLSGFGVDLGHYVIIINAKNVKVSGKKEEQKLYYRNSQRPGSLKIENLKALRARIPTRIIEQAVWGMLPKSRLGRKQYGRLYVYATSDLSKINKDSLKLKKIDTPK